MTEKTTDLIIGKVSLLSVPNAIDKAFQIFDSEIIKPDDVKDFEVNTDESCNIAESKIRQINKLKTRVEDKRKELASPLTFIKNLIQSNAKKREEQLAMSKSLLNTGVTTFKSLKQKQLEAAEEEKRAELNKDVERKENIRLRINKMLSNFTSLLFGGDVIQGDDNTSHVDCPSSVDDISKVREFIVDNFPSIDAFQEFSDEVGDHYSKIMNDIELYKSYMEDGDIDSIKALKIKYYALCERVISDTEKIVEKEKKKVDKSIETEIKLSTKGLREIVEFDVEDPNKVPERYKIVDRSKIIDYRKRNIDEIRALIKKDKGHTLIPGIKFRIRKQNVSY